MKQSIRRNLLILAVTFAIPHDGGWSVPPETATLWLGEFGFNIQIKEGWKNQ